MSGQLSILNTYLDKYDPTKIIKDMVDLQNEYNRRLSYDKFPLWNRIRLAWIEKVKYPRFKRRVYNMTRKMISMLHDHPDYLLLLSQRSVSFLINYCYAYELDYRDYLYTIFGDSVLFDVRGEEKEGGVYNIQAYTIVVRAPIPVDVDDMSKDKYSITTLDAQLSDRTYTISQKVYNCSDESQSSTAKILFENRYELDNSGRLTNPNYSFSRELLEEDLENYRLIIGQLLLFMSGMIEKSTDLVFVEMNVHMEE